MASEVSKELANGNWQNVLEMVRRDRNHAAMWASKPGQLAQGPFLFKESLHGLPVHEAISVGAPIEVVDTLIRAYPNGLIEKEHVMSRLPLHIACKNTPVDPKIVKLLIKYSPESATEADKLGRVALHYALENCCSQEVVKYLLRACPDTAKAQDQHGATPLHMACRFGHPTVVIGALLQLSPDSCVMCMDDGKTALACAGETDAPNKGEVVTLLAQYKRGFDVNFRVASQPSSRRLLV